MPLTALTRDFRVSRGSWWAFVPGVFLCGGAVARHLEEERFLTISLTGYAEYRERVRHRLIPFVW